MKWVTDYFPLPTDAVYQIGYGIVPLVNSIFVGCPFYLSSCLIPPQSSHLQQVGILYCYQQIYLGIPHQWTKKQINIEMDILKWISTCFPLLMCIRWVMVPPTAVSLVLPSTITCKCIIILVVDTVLCYIVEKMWPAKLCVVLQYMIT